MASMAAAESQGSALERRFKFAEHGTTLARDTMAGVTTFIVMSYIIFLNPQILSFRGISGLESKGLLVSGTVIIHSPLDIGPTRTVPQPPRCPT